MSILENVGTGEEIDYESLPINTPLASQLFAGAFAGVMEHTVMFPIDVLKTRIQSNVTLTNGYSNVLLKTNSNVITQLTKITTNEGFKSLWKGLSSVLLGAGPAHAVYFATYEFTKSKLMTENAYSSPRWNPLKIALSGASATILSDALLNPFDTVKQRMQISKNSTIFGMTKLIYQKEGLRAFYYSYPTTLAMNIPFVSLNFVIYETSTAFLNPSNKYNPYIHCLCGGISGATCAALTTPLDCIKTVLQVRGSNNISEPILKNADTFAKASRAIYKLNGYRGFLKGLKPRVIANMPATAISWTAYECAKHFFLNKNNSII
ncbi:hypothetical protein TBLA_0B07860 [Henningerozyma blattae CBS 6284]|uniref:Mitochondrial thiamine pyrophosphate carrier 1 n=1 Tax=Henningerozyma blattae (strain ATCC 34711 / CBS 6284 / DSM 70876 / NBRC 10599 / NRRL Y-10934 / UCD 77-7) TaxID=1071380 RepID=I2GZQ0_HENB6|nr:hypothetical protein TBLA_0B07860 [Tetrapisispora blattae CBS 6284]CCH59602.1 hypothetical protein TBLA_0B07860 [Tetrapisispora blattae CBS 6284]